MAFREISAWIILIAFAWVAGNYAWPLIEARDFSLGSTRTIFMAMISFIIIVVIAHIIIAIMAPKIADESDERDRMIDLYGERAGGFILAAAALNAMAFALINEDLLYANILFLGLVFSEIIKNIWKIALYRRNA